jgi:hypothetical protein
MSTRSALAGAGTTAVLVAALGNPGVVDAALDADEPALAFTLTGFPNWDVPDGATGEVVGGVVLRLVLATVLVGLLCALVGRSRSRGAAFVGGWGALVIAAGIAGATSYVYQVAVVLDGNSFGPTYLDGLVQTVNAGAAFGLWTGWLVGAVVALATRPAPVPVPGAMPAAAPWPVAPPPERRITEPPPPWWAPTQASSGDTAVRPGPTVFPPGGMPPVTPGAAPVAPAPAPAPGPAPAASSTRPANPDATREMTTASGDPHPSDPDATHAVGLPRVDEDADDHADPDATATMPESTDSTTEMPRKTD